MRSLLCTLTLLVFGTACGPGQRQTKKEKILGMDSLIRSQVILLTEVGAALTKRATVSGEVSDEIKMVPDSLQWRENLEIFSEADPARTAGGGAINVQRIPDHGSNLLVDRFTFSGEESIREMKIFSDTPGGRIRRITLHYVESNSLAFDERRMIMDFDDRQGKDLLTHYHVAGLSKLIMKDTVHYTLEGSIQWPL